MALYWIVNVLIIGVLSKVINHYYNCRELRNYFYPALLVKLASGICVGLIYTYYYNTGDTFRFHLLSIDIYQYGLRDMKGYFMFMISNPDYSLPMNINLSWEPRTLFFVKFLSLFNFITGGNYWINSLYLSFLSFFGSWLLIQKVVKYNPEFLFPVMISFACFPTVVFWSSGILKESLGMFCFGVMSFIFLGFFLERKARISGIMLFLLVAIIYWQVKYYIVIIMIVAIGAFIISDLLKSRFKQIPGLFLFTLSVVILIIPASFLHPNFKPGKLAEILEDNHENIIAISSKRNIIPFVKSDFPVVDKIVNIPISLFGGLFMPLPFQGDKTIALIPGLLNLFVLISSVVLFLNRIEWPTGRSMLLIYSIIFYIIALAILLTYSNPNFGTLERYKVSYLPLFLFLILAGNRSFLLKAGRMIDKLKFRISD